MLKVELKPLEVKQSIPSALNALLCDDMQGARIKLNTRIEPSSFSFTARVLCEAAESNSQNTPGPSTSTVTEAQSGTPSEHRI